MIRDATRSFVRTVVLLVAAGVTMAVAGMLTGALLAGFGLNDQTATGIGNLIGLVAAGLVLVAGFVRRG